MSFPRLKRFRPGRRWPAPRRGIRLGVALATAALLTTSCTKTYQRSLFETPCGPGKLTFTLHVTTQPPAPSDVKLWLEYEVNGQRRLVDVLKPRLKPYRPAGPAERRTRLRPGPDAWPVFVNPREFSVAEYELIRKRLGATLGDIDNGTANLQQGESLDFGNAVKLSSVRYLDLASLRHTYTGAFRGVSIDVLPDGAIWCNHARGSILVGSVVARGTKALLLRGYRLLEHAGISNPLEYILSCKDADGHTLGTDFEVEPVSAADYDAAMQVERSDREGW